MRPIEELPDVAIRGLDALLLDIDDTLTTEGRLAAHAYAALERAHDLGLVVVPVTGRPAGWCDHIARMWPVDAVVGENGAFYFRYLPAERRLVRCYVADAATRAAQRARLEGIGRAIVAAVPGSAIAADQAWREADLAIDFCEDVPALDTAAVARIVAIMEEAGMTAKVSSIHVNGWFGAYDKLGMSRRLFAEQFGIDIDRDRARIAYIGDSPNDAPMFAHFPYSVGVANVRDFVDRIESLPGYVTLARAGAGFAECVARIARARGTPGPAVV